MSKTHVVEQGEHISGITVENGFRSFHTIWDRSENADLRAKRDPHVLFPGDKIFIPDLAVKTESRPTGQIHRFVVPVPPLYLRLKVLDLNNRPAASAQGQLKLGPAESEPVSTDKDGFVIHTLEPKVKTGELQVDELRPKAKPAEPDVFEKLEYELRIGSLNPEKKMSGQQARLNNLGYFAGYTLNDLEQLLWAAEEFDCDRIKNGNAPVKKRPSIVGVPLTAQDKGEEKGDPGTETGIQDGDIRSKLKEFHGC